MAIIKSALSGVIIDPDRLVIGCEEGLYCLDLDRTGTVQILTFSPNRNFIIPNFF